MQNPANQFQIVTCPKCNGFGYVVEVGKSHKACPLCHGIDSIYGVVDGKILYWNKEINKQSITQEKFEATIKNIINFSLFILGFLGVATLVYYIYSNVYINPSADLDFIGLLLSRDKLMFAFWLSIIVDMYIAYRIDTSYRKEKFIKPSQPSKEEIITDFSWQRLFKQDKKNKINIADYLTLPASNLLKQAYLFSKNSKQHEVSSLNILAAGAETNEMRLIFMRLTLNNEQFIAKISRAIKSRQQTADDKDLDFGLSAKKALLAAYYQAYVNGREQISPAEILLGLITTDDLIADLFDDLEIDFKKIASVCQWSYLDHKLVKWIKTYRGKAKHKPKSHMNRAMTARPTKLLDNVSQDFTLKARYGHFFPLVGREKEVSEAFRVLKQGRGNVILVGDAGVGKTTILEGIAQMMTSEDVPVNLQDKRLVVLDPGVLTAGADGIGGLEQRLVQIVYEIAIAGNVILAIEDIHHLLGIRSTQGPSLGEVLMNFLSQGYIQVIATTTTKEYQQIIGDKETFLRRFQLVKIGEMNEENTIKVLEAKSGLIENKNKTYFSYDALESCVSLTNRYIKDRYLPAKALDIMEEAAIYSREHNGENSFVTKQEVAAVLSEKTNVEVGAVTESEANKLLNLEGIMHERIVGQQEAVIAIAKALRRSREELRDNNRPIATFLFLGPTGVGKTETAKTLAEVYFGNEKNMIRLDMSEYQQQSSVNKMIGDANQKGYLTEAARQTPFSIVLLDELEKAHPDILNLFLQVFEDGRLTDGQGRTIDFTNMIIIATSNAESELLEKYFRPEFINRFDQVVKFSALTMDDTIEVATRMLYALSDKLQTKGILFQASPEAVKELAQKGYSDKYGARPLRRLLQDTVDDALAKLMLTQKIARRDVVILQPGGELEIQKAKRV